MQTKEYLQALTGPVRTYFQENGPDRSLANCHFCVMLIAKELGKSIVRYIDSASISRTCFGCDNVYFYQRCHRKYLYAIIKNA